MGSQILASAHALSQPNYLCLSILGRELRFGFNAKDVQQRRVPCKAMPEDFGVWGLAFV